jgi:hypothetical protein
MSSNVEAVFSDLTATRATQRDEAAALTPDEIASVGREMRRTGQLLGLAGALVMAFILAKGSILLSEWLMDAFILVVVGPLLGAHLGWRSRSSSKRTTFFASVAYGMLAPLPCGLVLGVVLTLTEGSAWRLVGGLYAGAYAAVFLSPVLATLSIVAALVLNWRRDVETRAVRA